MGLIQVRAKHCSQVLDGRGHGTSDYPSLGIRSVEDSSYSQNVRGVDNFGRPLFIHYVINLMQDI